MSGILVRAFEERDREGFFRVRAVTYNDGRPIPEAEQVFKITRGFVGELEGEIAGIYSVLDLTCTRGNAVLKCGGIAAVGVLPEKRQSGVGHAMMAGAVRDLRETGTQMASLYGFRESYYRKFGYEIAGRRFEIRCPNHRLPRTGSALPVRTVGFGEHGLLNPCYEAFARAHSGMSRRDDGLWGRILDENKTVYVIGDPIEAYAIVSHKVEFWAEQQIQECAWSSLAGHAGLMELFRGIGVNKTAVVWNEPTDSPFMTRYWDQGISFEPKRSIMFRVVDVPGALSKLVASGSGSFSVEVDDATIPENRGPWRVRWADGVVSVERCEGAQLRCSIQNFTQGFLGEPSFELLARMGFVEVLDSGGLEAACRLMPAMPTYCMEFF